MADNWPQEQEAVRACIQNLLQVRGTIVLALVVASFTRSGILSLRLLHELRLQLHRADAVDLAVDVVIAFDQADILNLRAHLHDE